MYVQWPRAEVVVSGAGPFIVLVDTLPCGACAVHGRTFVIGVFDRKNGDTQRLEAKVHAPHHGGKLKPGLAEIWQPIRKF